MKQKALIQPLSPTESRRDGSPAKRVAYSGDGSKPTAVPQEGTETGMPATLMIANGTTEEEVLTLATKSTEPTQPVAPVPENNSNIDGFDLTKALPSTGQVIMNDSNVINFSSDTKYTIGNIERLFSNREICSANLNSLNEFTSWDREFTEIFS